MNFSLYKGLHDENNVLNLPATCIVKQNDKTCSSTKYDPRTKDIQLPLKQSKKGCRKCLWYFSKPI